MYSGNYGMVLVGCSDKDGIDLCMRCLDWWMFESVILSRSAMQRYLLEDWDNFNKNWDSVLSRLWNKRGYLRRKLERQALSDTLPPENTEKFLAIVRERRDKKL